MENRDKLLSAGMIEPDSRDICGVKLRAFSLGSMQACYMLNLSLYTLGQDELPQAEIQRQITTFAWLHAAPESEVVEALISGNTKECVMRFSFSVPYPLIEELLLETQRVSQLIDAATVRVESKLPPSEDTAPGKS